jgi:ssRNA-specific RNase YbeY (16S rRNA maturation enzyme)
MTKSFLSTAFVVGMFSVQAVVAAVPTLAMTFDTNVTPLGTTSAQEAKIQAAEIKIKHVVGTDEFRSAVLNHTYNGKKTFVDNRGLTNAQIYQRILDAAETLQPKKNNTMDMGVKLYYQNSNVVGYTTPSIKFINMNTKYFNKYTSSGVSHNMMHEWLHKLGFGHAVNYSISRNYSVPYAIGNIMGKLALKY